ncbi:peroxidase family protein [Candidatus Nitronereus thalassa]|uniref:Peroxidase family protein n=1 Tax=Candidatus Nitronereus thalassa TaxID=3020898 RepID=A0ABU3K971_9BACT|nr:peroxidase family protein [Candidatus Nitronereus thalassa]MDT7042933.1 peroxidase family protein [Candidatus Nitronereus thalassa]
MKNTSTGRSLLLACILPLSLLFGCVTDGSRKEEKISLESCKGKLVTGVLTLAKKRENRFLGKVSEQTALCRGGTEAAAQRDTPWNDWANYYAVGDATSKREGIIKSTGPLSPNGRGINGALLDLELQRIGLIKFNLYDNSRTFEHYIKGREGIDGPALKTWPEMQLPAGHPHFQDVSTESGQLCQGELIRQRTLMGICNDIKNPLMGSTGMLFARNVEFDETFSELSRTELIRNRHGERIGLLTPDPQIISRKLFTRTQSDPSKCQEGSGLEGYSKEANCDYKKAPFFNVLAAYWIQFMTHDWFAHLDEGNNHPESMTVGCRTDLGGRSLSDKDISQLGCRPGDAIGKTLVAEDSEPETFTHNQKSYLTRAPKTFHNHVTAWWDASQLYGYDQTSLQRVKRDPSDPAKLLLVERNTQGNPSNELGYLPLMDSSDPMHDAWQGQEAAAFPDNWTVGLSFLHNVFAREHNLFVEKFRKRAANTPDEDSGLRNPVNPNTVIAYKDVTPEELYQAARLVVSAEIAKIHTIEWTTQLLYNEALYKGMNSNWSGLFAEHPLVAKALEQVVVNNFGESENSKKQTTWYSVFAVGPGIFGLGNERYRGKTVLSGLFPLKEDVWDLTNPDHVNGGVNHFGSPFNFPEEFISVYRLHPLVPDLLEYRELSNPNVVKEKVPVVDTFRAKATEAMRSRGLANWATSLGRQRLGLLTLQNHPQFLQNLTIPHLNSSTHKIDVAALDLIRDRERGIPRYNEFRRQYALKQLTSFNDFNDERLPADSPAREEQEQLVKALREVYGQHRCDASKIITQSQVNDDGSPINDCLGHPDGTVVDNIEDVDTIVGYLAESTRPHGFAISETQFVVFILNASRRLYSDRFFTSSFRPEFYSYLGVDWVNDNGPTGKVMEKGKPNDHEQEMLPMKRILLRTMPELSGELEHVVNAFDPWARDRGEYYSLDWKPRPGAEDDEAFFRNE